MLGSDKAKCFEYDKVTKEEGIALKQLYAGEADAHQQRLALQLIVKKFARAHDLAFIPGAPDESVFLAGRSFVGKRILRYLEVPVDKLDKTQEEKTDE